MTYLDSAILDLTERLCRRFQLLTGRTNVWLAAQLTNLSIVLYFVWAALYFQNVLASVRLAVGVFCAGVLYALTQTVFKASVETSESNAYRRVAKGLRNPRRLRDAPLRVSFLTVCLFYPVLLVYFLDRTVALLSYSLIFLTTALLYVLGCDPLPPCRSKIRERLRLPAASPVAAPDSAASRYTPGASGTA
jgi:hypothetical protein